MSVRNDYNLVEVSIQTELGCDPHKGEYSLQISSFIGSLDISSRGGSDDISCVVECVQNNLVEIAPVKSGTTTVLLRESGEREDVFWNKFYVVERVIRYEDALLEAV